LKNFPKKIRKAIYLDITAIIIINLILFYIFNQIDLFELLIEYTKNHENIELDEIIPVFISLSFSLGIFAFRRILELTNLVSETNELSIRDYLTGLYNRRYISDIFDNELNRSRRNNTQFSLLMIDIDNFKKINDTFGHNVGDNVLSEISERLLSVSRKADIISRWGGEEFLILCPGTGPLEASKTAERLLSVINSSEFKEVKEVTISIGVVTHNKDENFEAIVNRADECLYKAKENGKNDYISG
jgi:diguanylate cyclase (GGDEF)-like protein